MSLFLPFLEGNLLIDPTGGTVLFNSSSSHDDQASSARALGFTGNFFGSPKTNVRIITNGNANFSGNTDYSNTSMPTAVERINPLWTDLIINSGSGASISEKVLSGTYYSSTWTSLNGYSSSSLYTFQFAWFGSNHTISGFTFQPNDIAYSYGTVQTPFPNGGVATIGLDRGNGVDFSSIEGVSGGYLSNSQVSLIPTGVNSFFLFRPNGSSYTPYVAAPVLQNTVSIPSTANFIVMGTAQTGGASDNNTINSLTFADGSALNIFNTLSITSGIVDVPNGSATLSGIIGGSGNLVKQGIGTLTLSGSNTYSGSTTINGGILQLGVSNALPTGTILTLANTTGAALNLNNFSQTIGSLLGGGATGGNVTLGSGTLTVGNTTSTTYGGSISGTGNLVKQGTGTLTLSGTNTYSGSTTINGGILQLGGVNALPSGTAVTLANTAGAALNLNNFSVTMGSLSGGGTTGGNVTLGSGTLTVGNATSTTYGGSISGTGSLIKQGTGTLILTGANTYSGGTTINGGTLQGNTTSLQGNFLNNALLVFDQSGAGTFTGSITGIGSFIKQGVGTLTLNGTNTYSGSTTINGGILQLGGSNALPSGTAVTLANTAGAALNLNNFSVTVGSLSGGGVTGGNVTLGSGTLTVGDATSTAYGGSISGTGNLIKQGTGTLTLSGANTYSGSTTINAGILQLGGLNALPSGTAVTLANTAGAALNLNNFSVTVGSLSGGGATGGNVTLGIGTLTVGNTTSTTYGGTISGTGNLVKQGTGTLTLSGTNAYSGSTMINAGILQLGGSNALPSGTAVNLANTAGAALNLNNFSVTIGSLSGGGTTGGNVTLGSGTLTVGDATSTAYGGSISGTGSLVKQGTGTLIVSGANTYSGSTTINGGILQLGGSNALPSGTALTLSNAAGAALNLNNFSVTIGSLSGGGATGGNVTLGSGTLTVGDATSTTYGGSISGTGSLIKQGTGTLTLAGANTYSGGTTISGGALQGDASSLQGNMLNNASLIFDQIGTGTYGGNISGTGSLTKENTGTLILTGSNSYSGGTTISGGTLQGNTTSLQGNILNNALLVFDQLSAGTFTGSISGGGNLLKQGTGTLTLNGINSYSGSTTINEGIVQLGVVNALPSGTAVTLANTAGATLNLNNFSVTIGSLLGGGTTGGNVTLGSGTLTVGNATNTNFAGSISGTGSLVKQGGGTLILTGTNAYSGGTTISGGTLQGNATSLQGDMLNNASLIFDQVGSGTFAGNISGLGSVTKQNSGTLILTGTNSYSGGTTISGGTLQGNTISLKGSMTNNALLIFDQLIDGTFTGDISGTGSLTKQGSGSLTLSGSNTYNGGTNVLGGQLKVQNASNIGGSSGSLLLSGGGFYPQASAQFLNPITITSGTVTVDNGITCELAGTIGGSGGLVKNGEGTLIISSSANTYTGTTSLNNGKLILKNTLLGPVIIQSTGTLAGNGTTGTLNNSGIISPGESIGIITVQGDFTQTSSGSLLIEIDDNPLSSDLLIVFGDAYLGGSVLLEPLPGIYTEGMTFPFLQANAIHDKFDQLIETNPLEFTFIYDPNLVSIYIPTSKVILPVPIEQLKGNAQSIAEYLFGCTDPQYSNELETIIRKVLKVPSSEFAEALLQLGPQQFGGIALSNLQSQTRVSGLMNRTKEAYNEEFFRNCCSHSEKRKEPLTPYFWVNSLGYYYQQNEREEQTPFRDKTFGFTTGGSTNLFDHLFVSCGVGYAHSAINWEEERGDATLHSIFLSPSIGYFGQYGYLGLVAVGSRSYYNVNRNIHFSTFKDVAHHHHTSNNLNLGLEGGFRAKFPTIVQKDLFLLPSFNLDYLNIYENGYQESGAGPLDLSVKNKHSSFIQSKLILKLLKEIKNDFVCFFPSLYFGWLSNIQLSSGKYDALFYKQRTCGFEFNVESYSRSIQQLILGLGFDLLYGKNFELKVKYEANLGNHASIQEGRVELRFNW